MSKNIQKNSFEKMCDELEKNYIPNKNEISYVREYIKSNISDDVDMLLKIKAEALEDDYWIYESYKIAIVALVFSAVGTITSLLPNDGIENVLLVVKFIYLLMIAFVTIKILKPQPLRMVKKWRKYVLIVIDEMVCEQKKKNDKKRKEKK